MIRHRVHRILVVVMLGSLLAGCGSEVTTESDTPAIRINEFMAQNDTALIDPDGTGGYPDWIELYNAGTSSVDMGGMHMSDDLTNPTKWRVPDGTVIAAGGYLLLWADNDDRQGSTHMTLKLATAGDEIGLFNTAENGYAAIDTIQFGQQTPDVSYGRLPDGSGTWTTMTAPTPGQANK